MFVSTKAGTIVTRRTRQVLATQIEWGVIQQVKRFLRREFSFRRFMPATQETNKLQYFSSQCFGQLGYFFGDVVGGRHA